MLTHRRIHPELRSFHYQDPLAWILGVAPSELPFVTDVLNKRVLLAHGGPGQRFSELLSFEVLDAVLGTFGLGPAEINVVRSDHDVRMSEYQWNDLVDPMRVARLFANGATVIFGALQNRHEPLRRLCSALAIQAGGRTQTNIYLTPPNSQGFKPHWDTHDVFILQVEGSKRWRFYAGGEDRPLAGRQFDPDEHRPGPVEAEVTVTAGDTLYIPRGVMHAAESCDDASLHITLGLIPYSWVEFVTECLAELALRQGKWRDNLPFGLGAPREQGVDRISRELQDRLTDLMAEVDVETVLASKMDDVGSAFRPRATNYLSQAATAAESLSREQMVQHRSNLMSRMEFRDERVVVVSEGRELDFPRIAERTVTRVLAGKPLRAGTIDDGLDWPGRKTVLSTMIRAGIVQTVTENPPS